MPYDEYGNLIEEAYQQPARQGYRGRPIPRQPAYDPSAVSDFRPMAGSDLQNAWNQRGADAWSARQAALRGEGSPQMQSPTGDYSGGGYAPPTSLDQLSAQLVAKRKLTPEQQKAAYTATLARMNQQQRMGQAQQRIGQAQSNADFSHGMQERSANLADDRYALTLDNSAFSHEMQMLGDDRAELRFAHDRGNSAISHDFQARGDDRSERTYEMGLAEKRRAAELAQYHEQVKFLGNRHTYDPKRGVVMIPEETMINRDDPENPMTKVPAREITMPQSEYEKIEGTRNQALNIKMPNVTERLALWQQMEEQKARETTATQAAASRRGPLWSEQARSPDIGQSGMMNFGENWMQGVEGIPTGLANLPLQYANAAKGIGNFAQLAYHGAMGETPGSVESQQIPLWRKSRPDEQRWGVDEAEKTRRYLAQKAARRRSQEVTQPEIQEWLRHPNLGIPPDWRE